MVLLMTPGLAFFYGGMVRTKHILMMIKMSFAALAFGTLVWWVIGYSLAFGPDVGGAGLIGILDHVLMHDIELNTLTGHIPTYVYSTFQMGFAIITVALISGSIADRATMKGWLVFVVGFRAEDEYDSVPGTDRERAYDFQTAERLGALVSGKAVTSDDELVRQITKLLRAREESK